MRVASLAQHHQEVQLLWENRMLLAKQPGSMWTGQTAVISLVGCIMLWLWLWF